MHNSRVKLARTRPDFNSRTVSRDPQTKLAIFVAKVDSALSF